MNEIKKNGDEIKNNINNEHIQKMESIEHTFNNIINRQNQIYSEEMINLNLERVNNIYNFINQNINQNKYIY